LWKRRRCWSRYDERHFKIAELALAERKRAMTEAHPGTAETTGPARVAGAVPTRGGAGEQRKAMGAHDLQRAAIPLSPASLAAKQAAVTSGLSNLVGTNAATQKRCQDDSDACDVLAEGCLIAREAAVAVSINSSQVHAGDGDLDIHATNVASAENVGEKCADAAGSEAKPSEVEEGGKGMGASSVARETSESVEGEGGRGAEVVAQSSP
jgi:hypothetical protein